jgi:hypothetical protein
MREGEPRFEEQEEPQYKPQPPEEQERTQGLMRVVGSSPEKQQQIIEESKERFDKKVSKEEFTEELELTPDKLKIMDTVLSKMPEFIEQFGGKMPPITKDHILIMDYNKLDDKQKKLLEKTYTKGMYDSQSQKAIILFDSKNQNNEDFAGLLTHEIMHFCAFQSMTAKEVQDKPKFFGLLGGKDGETRMEITPRVLGLSLIHKNGKKLEEYYNEIDEAVTTILTDDFYTQYLRKIPEIEEDSFSRFTRPSAEKANLWSPMANYQDFKIDFSHILIDILQKNPQSFKTKEDVFNVFAKAYFTGKRLELAKAIEKTYGKGSFRELGKGKNKRKIKTKYD